MELTVPAMSCSARSCKASTPEVLSEFEAGKWRGHFFLCLVLPDGLREIEQMIFSNPISLGFAVNQVGCFKFHMLDFAN